MTPRAERPNGAVVYLVPALLTLDEELAHLAESWPFGRGDHYWQRHQARDFARWLREHATTTPQPCRYCTQCGKPLPAELMMADTTEPDTRHAAEVIAKVPDRAFNADHATWLAASVDVDAAGAWGVIVTLGPDVGYDSEYRLTLKEV